MNIMISINREYIGYACIMLMSLKQHHKGIMLFVHILHNELQDEDFWRMDEIIGSDGIELIPVFVPKGTVKEFQIGSWPEPAAYRLLETDLFASSLERILHLDVDILITGDISEFNEKTKYAKRTPFYLEMKTKHVQAMINKEQKLKSLIDDKLGQTVQCVNSVEELIKAEELLFQMLGLEFAMANVLNNR